MSGRPRRSLALLLAGVSLGMLGLTFAAVPLYRVFCAVTGYGGTPQIGPEQSASVSAQTITVQFNANVAPNLPWHFAPEQPRVTVRLGEPQVIWYTARNDSSGPLTGIALYNVTPEKVGKYFHKTACFCFNQQTLSAHGVAQLPVSFWVDPAIAADPNTREVAVITLSYTFFHTLGDAARSGALAKADQHLGPALPIQPQSAGG